ncbi:MAG: quinone oxidoreductase [Novosphingobium sp.]|nr:quinone oxidoreductase [Novosphingobium sp.]
MKTRIIRIEEHGGPEVLRPATIDLPPPGPGEIRIRQTAVGVNYHDVYVRSGLYRTLPLPGVPGIEAVGVVEQTGEGVCGFSRGDRIAYVASTYGCYAEARNLPADLAIHLPDGLGDAEAAASFMKAMTVDVLIRQVRQVRAGEWILVHAAAGGVGQLLTSWASHLGANVIATAGSEEKAKVAHAHGARHVVLYRDEDVPARVREITSGEGVAAAYDSVGADTFQGSMDSLGLCGHLVLYGQASGPVAPIAPTVLAGKSLSLTRPIMFHYIRTRQRLEETASACFDAFEKGIIQPLTPLELPLEDAARAHEILEARQSPGGIVLLPGEKSAG